MSNNYQYPIRTQEKSYNIHKRIFSFIVNVLNFLNKLPKNYSNQVCINQLTRSVTSMGANDQEADGALTNRDFIHGFTLVRKEGKESIFWLKLIGETNSKFKEEINPIVSEGSEIVAIISAIIRKASLKTRDKH